jgi:hypothetical protein
MKNTKKRKENNMTELFEDVNPHTGEVVKRGDFPSSAAPQMQSGLISVEQGRAVAEVQAALLIARTNPRDEFQAFSNIIKACQRVSLAEAAHYAFKRGKAVIDSPSIRLVEVVVRLWGNITYGFRELGRREGISDVEAFAWDLESNTKVTRQFQVRHIRDKTSGNVALKKERDIYELVANMAQRRVRACMTALIPGDIMEAASKECIKTLASSDGRPMEDRVRDMVLAFEKMGVTSQDLEKMLGHPLKVVVPAEMVRLQQVWRSIKDGIADKSEFFGALTATKESKTPPAPKTGTPEPEPPLEPAKNGLLKIGESLPPDVVCNQKTWGKLTALCEQKGANRAGVVKTRSVKVINKKGEEACSAYQMHLPQAAAEKLIDELSSRPDKKTPEPQPKEKTPDNQETLTPDEVMGNLNEAFLTACAMESEKCIDHVRAYVEGGGINTWEKVDAMTSFANDDWAGFLKLIRTEG